MPDWAERRDALVSTLRDRDTFDAETLDAIRSVPRHRFVPERNRSGAYEDTPLPIGHGQTISAPHMVAIMTDLLTLSVGTRVLELGTGCGYHAAVTAAVVGPGNVYSVEYHEELAERARQTLSATGYGDVSVRAGDGKQGWPDHAPYDRAYLTCAASELPPAVVDQVTSDGLLVAPLGSDRQTLVRAQKRPDGSLAPEEHGYVRFVPLQ